jgi:hypothetical protein
MGISTAAKPEATNRGGIPVRFSAHCGLRTRQWPNDTLGLIDRAHGADDLEHEPTRRRARGQVGSARTMRSKR